MDKTSDPVEMCSFYFMCHFMLDSQTPLSIVRVPIQMEKDNSLISYRSTGEIPAEELGTLIKYEEPISQCQRSAYANIWSDLECENTPPLFCILFAVHSGKIENEEVTYHYTREIFENGKVVSYSGSPYALFE